MALKRKKAQDDATLQSVTEPAKHTARARIGDNRLQIRLVAVFFALLFVAMGLYLSTFLFAENEEEMIENTYNVRSVTYASRTYRGTIYDRNGTTLAYTDVDADQNETRVYSYGSIFSHVLGYATKGGMGIESMADYYLISSNISAIAKAQNDMNGVKNQGNSVYTTLDVNLQKVADAMLGDYDGAIIVTEVKTGKVLAMVSHPNFDPGSIDEVWESLLEDTESSVLVNRATQGLYPPGSTFKIVTALEYLRENDNDISGYSYYCNSKISVETGKIQCYHGTSHGTVSFLKSFAKSCNCSFANIGLSLNKTSFADTLKDLLFNQALPVDFAYSQSSVTISEETSDFETVQTAIGQGATTMTPLHLNMITSAIANDGVLMVPYLIDHIESATGRTLKTYFATTYGALMTEEEAAILQTLMEEVVSSGTATKLSNISVSVAGKTGSAEYSDSSTDSHAWFSGYAPAEDPEICVTVIVEGAGSGSDYAVPIAKAIFETYFALK